MPLVGIETASGCLDGTPLQLIDLPLQAPDDQPHQMKSELGVLEVQLFQFFVRHVQHFDVGVADAAQRL